jgi:hypothetical protein
MPDPKTPHSADPRTSDPMLGDLFVEIGHKLKNKLGGVHGFASLMEKDIPEGHSLRPMIRKIQDGVMQMNGILVDFMKVVREEEADHRPADAGTAAVEAWAEFVREQNDMRMAKQPWTEKPAVDLTVRTDPDLLVEALRQCLRHAALSGGAVRGIDASGTTDDVVRLRLETASSAELGPDSLGRRLQTGPFEARLALAVAWKLTRAIGGTLAVLSEGPERSSLVIELKRERAS